MSRSLDAQTEARPATPALIRFVMRGLDHCWMPEHNRWSHTYLLDDVNNGNVSVPHSDVFYTLNCVLGLSRVDEKARAQYDLQKIFDINARLVPTLPSRDYTYGMILWAGARAGFSVPADLANTILALAADESRRAKFKAQDLGMLLTGCAAQVANGDARFAAAAQSLYALLRDGFATPTGLFRDSTQTIAGRFSSFATHVYSAIAAYSYGEQFGDASAIALANKTVEKLIDLQGPNGEWPWYYHSPLGRVADLYDVYSVHQHGMAPALLEYAERNGVARAASAREKGFQWILGRNDLGVSMLRPKEGLIVRSQTRRGELEGKSGRARRAALSFISGSGAKLAGAARTELRRECRSYELGWTCWSFGGRADLLHLSDHAAFDAT